jgi:hypothetical protein
MVPSGSSADSPDHPRARTRVTYRATRRSLNATGKTGYRQPITGEPHTPWPVVIFMQQG